MAQPPKMENQTTAKRLGMIQLTISTSRMVWP